MLKALRLFTAFVFAAGSAMTYASYTIHWILAVCIGSFWLLVLGVMLFMTEFLKEDL